MDAKLDGIDNKLGAAVIHISAIEHGLAGLKADFAAMQASMHSIDRRLDKIEDHIELVIA